LGEFTQYLQEKLSPARGQSSNKSDSLKGSVTRGLKAIGSGVESVAKNVSKFVDAAKTGSQ